LVTEQSLRDEAAGPPAEHVEEVQHGLGRPPRAALRGPLVARVDKERDDAGPEQEPQESRGGRRQRQRSNVCVSPSGVPSSPLIVPSTSRRYLDCGSRFVTGVISTSTSPILVCDSQTPIEVGGWSTGVTLPNESITAVFVSVKCAAS